MGRVAYLTVGGCQVLKPSRGLVSFRIINVPCALHKIRKYIN